MLELLRILRFIALGFVLIGCGPSGGPDSSSSSTTSDMHDGEDDDPPTPDLPNVCEPPLVLCEGECIYTFNNDYHCGGCGNSCLNYGAGAVCIGSDCTPAMIGCIDAEDGFTTCNDYCASIDQSCVSQVDTPSNPYTCGIASIMHKAVLPTQTPCSHGSITTGSAGCAEPIPFNKFYHDKLYTHASCCCTSVQN